MSSLHFRISAAFTPTASGDHALYADMCQGFGCGGTLTLSIEVADPRDGTVQVVQQWDGLTNLPDAMSGRALGLEAGVKYGNSELTGLVSNPHRVLSIFACPPRSNGR